MPRRQPETIGRRTVPRRTKTDLTPPRWEGPSQRETIVLKLKLVTPLFGGGFEARNVDELVPVRAAAIRGNLRYWWRATAGARYATPKELYEAETALWGGAARIIEKEGREVVVGEGRVQLSVVCLPLDRRNLTRIDRADVPRYARAILIQEKSATEKRIRSEARNENWPKHRLDEALRNASQQIEDERDLMYPWVLPSCEFTLGLAMIDGTPIPQEVLGALRAFIDFGGVGGRCQRGFGSLVEVSRSPSSATNGWPPPPGPPAECWHETPGCSSLVGATLFTGAASNSPVEAWKAAVQILEHFRRAELPGYRRPATGVPSHTSWPEADMIRALLNPPVARLGLARPPGALPVFPRAELGLPLTFQSQKKHTGYFGNAKLWLQTGQDAIERLRSPVIAKAMRYEGQWYPAILILSQASVAASLRVSVAPTATLSTDCTGSPATLWNGIGEVPFGGRASTIREALEHYLSHHAEWTPRSIAL